jgi:hypothetical protein
MFPENELAPDIGFLRNTGIALCALTAAVGAITIFGSITISDQSVLAQSVDVDSPTSSLRLKQIDRDIFLRGLLQALYVNPKPI